MMIEEIRQDMKYPSSSLRNKNLILFRQMQYTAPNV